MTVGDRIKMRREEIGMAQNTLAEKIGIKKQTLYKYETNVVTNVPSDNIEKIAKVLDISPAYLMGWEEREFNPETAELVYKVRDDAELMEALKKYFALSEEEKRHIIELINMLSKKEG